MEHPAKVEYDYVTGFKDMSSSNVSSAASGGVMHVVIKNTVASDSYVDDGCNAGLMFPALLLVVILIMKRH